MGAQSFTDATDTDASTFSTHDLYATAFLIVKGHQLLGLSGSRHARREFNFPAAARAALHDYLTGASVPARDYAAALRSVKTRLFQD
jgi:hypothetical protein